MLKKITAWGIMISMAVANEQVPFEQWGGRDIIENIIRTQEYPDQQILINLANLLPSLEGGLKTIYDTLSNSWRENDETYPHIPDNLKMFRNRMIKMLEKIQALGNQI